MAKHDHDNKKQDDGDELPKHTPSSFDPLAEVLARLAAAEARIAKLEADIKLCRR